MPLALRSVSRLGVARLAMAGRRVGRAPWVAVARHSTLAQPATAPAAPPLAALAPRKLSPQSSLAHFHSTPTPLAHPEPEDPDARNPSKAAIVAQLLKDSKALDDAKDALSDSAIGPAPAAANAPAPAAPEKKAKEPLWNRIKHEIQHYYHGTRLFIAESRISFRLLLKMSRGVPLTRREHKQLVRTSADMFRLIPMMVFIVVPFMEFALPLALKIWPNMLPSTFESKFAEEEKRKKLLKVRLDVAKFLQDTISEISVGSGSGKGIEEKGIKEFGEFFGKYRTSGQLAPTEEIVRVAAKFDDETILSNLSRPQLASMCKFVAVSTFGTDDFLRYMLKKKMRDIKKDDKMIAAEGIDSLDLVELAAACSARGIRTIGVSPARMRLELQQWIDLHLNHRIPSTLLLLSRAFAISDAVPVVKHVPAAEALQATLQSLPDEVKEETKMVYSEAVGAKIDPREKLELLKKQEHLIAEELKQEADEKKRAVLQAAKEKVGETVVKAETKPEAAVASGKVDEAIRIGETARAATPEVAAKTVERAAQLEVREGRAGAAAPVSTPAVPAAVAAAAAVAAEKPKAKQALEVVEAAGAEVPATTSDTNALKQLGEALEVLVSPSAFKPEMDDLKEIKKDREEYREDLSLIASLVAGATTTSKQPLESKAGTMLGKRLDGLLKRIDAELHEWDTKIGDKLNLLKANEEGLIPMEQVVKALESIKVGPDSVTEKRIEQLIDSLDPDGDGMVFLSDVKELSHKLQELEEEPLERAHKAALALKAQLAAAAGEAAVNKPDAAAAAKSAAATAAAPPEARPTLDIPVSSNGGAASTMVMPPPSSSNGLHSQPPMSASAGGSGEKHQL